MYKWSAWTVSALVMSFGLYMVYNVIAQLFH
jgi:hypothetical protein